jgi:hypothetical protein
MFHSFPALFIFAGIAFLITGASPIEERCFKAGGVAAGCLSHLILDEIYAIEWKGGRWRFKKSFGTAMKFWGDDAWSNFSTYAKLAVVAMIILGEPSVMQQLETRNPQFAAQLNDLRNRVGTMTPNTLAQGGPGRVNSAAEFLRGAVAGHIPTSPEPSPAGWPQVATAPQPFNPPQQMNNQPAEWRWPAANQQYPPPQDQQTYNNAYDTAQRPYAGQYPQ